MPDLSPSPLAGAVKANLYGLFGAFARSPEVELWTQPALRRWCTRIPDPWFNGLLVSQVTAAQRDAIVQEAIAYFSAQRVTRFILWPAVDVNAAAWKADLAAQGFHYDANTPGMAVELARLPDSTPHAAGLVIRPVEDLATLRLWTRIHAAGFGMPPSTTGPIYDLLASLGADRSLRFYLGYLGGQPVAISTLFLESDVAGIYDVATLPEARRKGIGAAMTLAPLLAMREAGCRVGILQSSAMGYYVYLRLGFVTVCKMEHFFWPAHDHAENQ